ncbi:nuclear receptor coactivator 7-like isoform X2 [Cyprinus carpio]|uniref:Nuclear receptor coactivator 7-like isoform X2 n=1 Tax=Cyprinus carpio TaxID=7962 RepID=A0A9Q9Z0N0_CYPCA|nr:nuclear receptor coactivator 7-like isoform X2 [Cyprinus carpio]
MGVVYSVGEVDHLYTFFVQWSPETIYSKHSSRQDFLRVHALSVIDSFLSHSASEQWESKTNKQRKPHKCTQNAILFCERSHE